MEIKTRQEQQEAKRQFWKEQVQLWQESGLSQKEYCRQHNLRENQLTYWKKRYVKTESAVSLVELKLSSSHCVSLNLSGRSALRLNLGRGYQVEVDNGFDPVTLKQLIYVLGQT